MVILITRYGMLLLLLTGLPLLSGIRLLLNLWVGADYSCSYHAASIAQFLVVANIIRLCVTPFVVAMLGCGEQRLVILTPLLEGFTNLVCSLIAGYFLGALGVAIGTLIGAIVGVLGMFLYNMPRTSIQLDRRQYLRSSILRPCLSAIPIALLWLIPLIGVRLKPEIDVCLKLVGFRTTGGTLLWLVGLTRAERHTLVQGVLVKVS